MAQQLQEIGLKKDDVIGFIAKNHHYTAPVVIAAMSIGTPINTLDPTFLPGNLKHWHLVNR